MRKQDSGALLGLCLLLGLLAIGALRTAGSRGEGGRGGASALLAGTGGLVLPEAVYEISGDSVTYTVGITEEVRYQTVEGGEWVYGSLADACANVYEGGRVEVMRDIDPSIAIDLRKPLTLGDGAILQNNNNVDTARGAGGQGSEDFLGEGGTPTQPMTIEAALTDGASIGVSRWTRPDDTHKYRFDEDKVTTAVKPQVLYAKWELNHYLIEYDVGGGRDRRHGQSHGLHRE